MFERTRAHMRDRLIVVKVTSLIYKRKKHCFDDDLNEMSSKMTHSCCFFISCHIAQNNFVFCFFIKKKQQQQHQQRRRRRRYCAGGGVPTQTNSLSLSLYFHFRCCFSQTKLCHQSKTGLILFFFFVSF